MINNNLVDADLKPSSQTKKYDFLIVGQGLAGTTLSYLLQKEKKQVLVFSHKEKDSSSEIAAGMFTPLGGKRMSKAWMAEELLAVLPDFYKELEAFLKCNFYHPNAILQVLKNEEEKTYIQKRLNQNDTKKYIEETEIKFDSIKIDDLGAIYVKEGGWIDTKLFLDSFANFLKNNNSLVEEKFDYSKLQKQGDQWVYNNMIFDKVVFCEGYQATKNPFFENLPFLLCKGEVLTIKVKNLPKNLIIKKGVFLVNLKDDLYRVGATYDWHELDNVPTEKGKEFLTQKLDEMLNVEYEIVNHLAGVRPTVSNRKPLLLESQENKGIYLFNGLGTKGFMLAPYFSNLMKNWLIFDNKPIY